MMNSFWWGHSGSTNKDGSCLTSQQSNTNVVDTLMVSDIMSQEDKCWNVPLITSTFEPYSAAKILNTPLYSSVTEDRRLWRAEQNGEYSVRSAYRLCTQELIDTSHLHAQNFVYMRAINLLHEWQLAREATDNASVCRHDAQNVLEKKTQLLLAQRELNKIKKQLDSAENTKAKALSELDKANITLQELTKKLNTVRESKQSAIEESEVVKNQAKELEKALSQKAIGYEAWKQELEHARKEYTTTVKELDASKQELNKIRQDFDAALEAKLAAFQMAGEAQRSAKLNSEKINELSKEIATMKE
ncbi:WEB family protein [Trifolium repens]|nr:WEB family protein [Trifolium repens]